jgi:hypothetical protein
LVGLIPAPSTEDIPAKFPDTNQWYPSWADISLYNLL